MAVKFLIYGIQWASAQALPDEATISLPADLVEASEPDEIEWFDAVNHQLHSQFGESALSFQIAGEND